MARSWGRIVASASLIAWSALPGRARAPEAQAGGAPLVSVAPLDPSMMSAVVAQGPMVHVFDTRAIAGAPTYVNDHTFIQGPDGTWHLFGILHAEPMGDGQETEFVHAISDERSPARWREGSFVPAPAPHAIALRADASLGETHLWAPHVVEIEDDARSPRGAATPASSRRWIMAYQGGGAGDYDASMRLAESDDLYRWTRVGRVPIFEDFCAARDPMLVRRDGVWTIYYTRCLALSNKVSGVATRQSSDLVRWSEPHMALSLEGTPTTSNSAYTESPFVFERDGFFYLSVTAYPLSWDATLLYRSRAPLAFPDAPITRLRAHAAEWIVDGPRVWLTHAGAGQRGVWISPIDDL